MASLGRAIDIEADGLLDTVTQVWCICLEGAAWSPYRVERDWKAGALAEMQKEDTLIFHNGIGYDLPALKLLHGFNYQGKVIDTMILSQLLYPERPMGHSLAAWGERLGFPKVGHEDWSQFSDEMLHRCEVDVELTRLVYEALCKEAGEEVEGIYVPEYQFNLKVGL